MKNSLRRWDTVSDETVTGEQSLVTEELSEDGIYVVTVVVVVAEVVETAVAESNLLGAVVVVRDTSKSMSSLSRAAMWLIDVNVMSVIGH